MSLIYSYVLSFFWLFFSVFSRSHCFLSYQLLVHSLSLLFSSRSKFPLLFLLSVFLLFSSLPLFPFPRLNLRWMILSFYLFLLFPTSSSFPSTLQILIPHITYLSPHLSTSPCLHFLHFRFSCSPFPYPRPSLPLTFLLPFSSCLSPMLPFPPLSTLPALLHPSLFPSIPLTSALSP